MVARSCASSALSMVFVGPFMGSSRRSIMPDGGRWTRPGSLRSKRLPSARQQRAELARQSGVIVGLGQDRAMLAEVARVLRRPRRARGQDDFQARTLLAQPLRQA